MRGETTNDHILELVKLTAKTIRTEASRDCRIRHILPYCLPLLGRSSILVVPSSALALQHSSHLADVRPAGICSDHFKNTGDFSVRYLSVYWLYILISQSQ